MASRIAARSCVNANRVERIERLHDGDLVAVAQRCGDELRKRGAGARRAVARLHVILVEKDREDAAAARLQADILDASGHAGIGDFEIGRLQIGDGRAFASVTTTSRVIGSIEPHARRPASRQ